MLYFDNLDKITYDGNAVRDIFDRVLINEISDAYISYYNVSQGHKSLYMISYSLYKTPQHWWILALLNRTFDLVFDMQLPEEIIENLVAAEPDNASALIKFDEINTDNKAKEYIKVIQPDKINEVISKIIEQL